MKQPFDLDALNEEITLERLRLKNIKHSREEYKCLCKLLTRLRYHTNEDAKKLTKLRSKTYNKNKLELERSIVIQP